MLKPISKIAIILFITFLSGLVLTDCVLPEIPAEERAEIEIEEEEEIELAHLDQAEFVTLCEDGGGKKIVIAHSFSIQTPNLFHPDYTYKKIDVKTYQHQYIHQTSVPKYILYGRLKLYS